MRSGAAAGVAGTRIERTGARKAAGACARTVGEGTNVWCAIAIKGNINQHEGAQQVWPNLITANCVKNLFFFHVYVWLFFTQKHNHGLHLSTYLPTYVGKELRDYGKFTS